MTTTAKISVGFTNGILNWPADTNAFTDEGVKWMAVNAEDYIDPWSYEWHGKILSSVWFKQRHAKNLAKYIVQALEAGQLVRLGGHSYGTEIIRAAILRIREELEVYRRVNGCAPIQQLHLFAAAAPHDFEKAKWNELLVENIIGEIYGYISNKDGALAKSRQASVIPVIRSIRAILRLDYDWMGLTGPHNVEPLVAHRVRLYSKPLGHSAWIGADQLDDSMSRVAWPEKHVWIDLAPEQIKGQT